MPNDPDIHRDEVVEAQKRQIADLQDEITKKNNELTQRRQEVIRLKAKLKKYESSS